MNIGCRIVLNKINIQAYADDIVLLSPSPTSSGLQKNLGTIEQLIHNLDLLINTNKTSIIIFKNSKTNINNNLKFCLHNELLAIADHYKYLGTILTSNLSETLYMDGEMHVFFH